MSLVGNLEDLGLGEILQIVSLSRKSGILQLHSRGRQGRILFRFGQVVQATSSTCQQSLGEALIRKGCIDLATLKQALTRQEVEGFKERVGTILVRHFGVADDAIDEVVREQIESVVYSLFAWAEGTFEFELQDNIEVVDDTKLDPMQFMLDQGLNPQFLAMEGARIVDEQRRRGELPLETAGIQGGTQSDANVDTAFDLVRLPVLPVPLADKAGKLPIVLVDDDEPTRDAFASILGKGGYTVFSFSRSEDTLIQIDALCRQDEKPMVLIDLIMPRMDGSGILGGLELLELVSNNFPDLRVLVMSDYSNRDAERKVLELGYSHILKPRRTEVCDPAAVEEFAVRLLAELDRLEKGGMPVPGSGVVNLGDELRLEMGEDFPEEEVGTVSSPGVSLLRSMLEELNDPTLGGGIILLVLRFASEFMNRAVIFMSMRDEIVGLGQFGISDSGESADARVRKLRIPRDGDSILAEIIDARIPAVVRPEPTRWNRYLFDQLGEGVPESAFLGPIISEGRVIAVLYGDNLPENRPVSNTESLEIFLSQAGLAMERALLERKLMESNRSSM